MNLNEEEKALLTSYENNQWESKDDPQRASELEDWAAKAIQKNKRINIRLSDMDLNRLKSRAIREGIPYQTLVSSVIHKFVSGRLKEI